MVQVVLVGFAAGIAGALLYLSPIGGTLLAFPLFALCGLPLAIAGLGWNVLAAAIGGGVAAVTITAVSTAPAAVIYLVLFAVPLVWMTRLAGLSRQDADGTVEWYPLGRILFHGALAVAAGVTIVGVVTGYNPDAFSQELAQLFVAWTAQSPEVAVPPTVEDVEPFVRFNVVALPYTVSAIMTMILVFNMWLAARIAEASRRLQRPREPVWTVGMPVEAAVAFGIALVVSFLPGAVGQAGGTFVGALGAALALVGLAVLHATTVGNNLRTLILVSVYVLVVLFGFPLLLLAVLGLVETFLNLRARRIGGPRPDND